MIVDELILKLWNNYVSTIYNSITSLFKYD